MNCIKCGKEIPEGSLFCNFCGAKQELACPSCGTVLPSDARFCHMCGAPVQSEPAPGPANDDYDPYAVLNETEPAPEPDPFAIPDGFDPTAGLLDLPDPFADDGNYDDYDPYAYLLDEPVGEPVSGPKSIVPDGISPIMISTLTYQGETVGFRFKIQTKADYANVDFQHLDKAAMAKLRAAELRTTELMFDMDKSTAAKYGIDASLSGGRIDLKSVNGTLMSDAEQKSQTQVLDVSDCPEDCKKLAETFLNSSFYAHALTIAKGVADVAIKPDPVPQKPAPKPAPKVKIVVPNKQNFDKLFQITGRQSRATRVQNENTKVNVGFEGGGDPKDYLYGQFSITRKASGQAVPGLENLMAYALSEHGVYYATCEGKICFLGSDGKEEVLKEQKNVVFLRYVPGLLVVTYATSGYCHLHTTLSGGWKFYHVEVGELQIRHAPGSENFTEFYPNKQNFDVLFQIIGRKSNAQKLDSKWRLVVRLHWGDAHQDIYYQNTDADYRCYGCFTIIKKDPRHHYEYNDRDGSGYYIKGGVHPAPAFPCLKDLMAYALSDRGIYYVTREGKIGFLGPDGKEQILGEQKNVIDLNYEAGVLTVTYVKNRRQTAKNEHHDECGGYTEAWYDKYELDTGKLAIHHNPR